MEATRWRNKLKSQFKESVEWGDPCDFEVGLKSAEEVVEMDKNWIRTCDFLVVNMWKIGAGTCMEMFFANMIGKPILLLTKEEFVGYWLRHHSARVIFEEDQLLKSVEDFIYLINQKAVL